MTTLYAIFDGQVLLPEEPIPLPPNTRVRLHLEPAGSEMVRGDATSFLGAAQSLDLQGPPDWSERFDEYLYGHGEVGRVGRRAPSTGLFESTDPKLGDESELFKDLDDGKTR